MNAWEYLVISKTGRGLTSQKLNEYGDLGWELVTVTVSYKTLRGEADSPTRFYIFKRPQGAESS
ncbi:DUF4177 domain-containing protein [Chloroflexota bacterium]